MNRDEVCPVCGNSKHPQAYYCKRCGKVIRRLDTRHQHDRSARERALKESWDGQGFRCYYTGVRLVEDDHKNPRYLTFDHRTPRHEDDIVIVAAAINDMKSDLSDAEFRNMINQLANRFAGREFDESAFNLRHWKRA